MEDTQQYLTIDGHLTNTPLWLAGKSLISGF